MSDGIINFLPLLIVLLIISGIIWAIMRSRKNEKVIIDENGVEIRSGLGGWLILVGIGLVLSPFRYFSMFETYDTIFSDGSYELITTPGSEAYHPFWSTFIWGEIAFNILFLLSSFLLIILFFSKKKLFPKLYILIIPASYIFVIIDAMLIKVVLPNAPIFDADTITEIIRGTITTLIWVPYMMVSKRVKATFVN